MYGPGLTSNERVQHFVADTSSLILLARILRSAPCRALWLACVAMLPKIGSRYLDVLLSFMCRIAV